MMNTVLSHEQIDGTWDVEVKEEASLKNMNIVKHMEDSKKTPKWYELHN